MMRMTKTTAMERLASAQPRVSEMGASAGGTATLKVYKKYLPQIQKRNGKIVGFDFDKIVEGEMELCSVCLLRSKE